MSCMTPCNYCTMKRLMRRYESDGLKITLKPGSVGTMLLAHKPDEQPSTAPPDENPHFKAAFMELTSRCCC